MKRFIVLESIVTDSGDMRIELEYKGYMKLSDLPVYKCEGQIFELQEDIWIDVDTKEVWELSDAAITDLIADGVIKELK